jgi:hypothetical protein
MQASMQKHGMGMQASSAFSHLQLVPPTKEQETKETEKKEEEEPPRGCGHHM